MTAPHDQMKESLRERAREIATALARELLGGSWFTTGIEPIEKALFQFAGEVAKEHNEQLVARTRKATIRECAIEAEGQVCGYHGFEIETPEMIAMRESILSLLNEPKKGEK